MKEEEIERILNPNDVTKIRVVKTEWDLWDTMWHWSVFWFLFWIGAELAGIRELLE